MSEKEVVAGQKSGTGMLKGVPGSRIEGVGLLDLRGVTAEELSQIQVIDSVGTVLIDPGMRSAMAHITIGSCGAIVDIDPECRVIMEPWVEFSRSTLEAMPQGQKLALIGICMFKPDVPPTLITEKFETVVVVGILLAPAGVHGALLGKMQITGVSVTLPDGEAPVVHNIGQNTVTPGYLTYLADNSLYINIGQTDIAADVPAELLAQKFGSYYNMGLTTAPAPLLDLLRARCPTNLGQFNTPEAKPEEAESDAE